MRLKCKKCDKVFNKAWKLAQHVKREHPKIVEDNLGEDITKYPFPPKALNFCPSCGNNLQKYN